MVNCLKHYTVQSNKYGYSFFIGLKLSVLFLLLSAFVNLINLPDASVFILIVLSCIFIIELPIVNSIGRKDMTYLFLTIVISVLYVIAGLSAIMPWLIGLILLIFSVFGLFYYYRNNQFYLLLLCACCLIAMLCLLSYFPVNNAGVINNLVSFIMLMTIGFWLHKLYPNYYHLRWLDNYIRCLNLLLKAFESVGKFEVLSLHNSLQNLVSSVELMKHKPEQFMLASNLNNQLIMYSFFITDLIATGSRQDLLEVRQDIKLLYQAITKHQLCLLNFQFDEEFHQTTIIQIIDTWNKLCLKMFYR